MTFDYPGCAIHYELEGPQDGLPVLMLHGFGCELSLMRGCMEPAIAAAGYGNRLLRIYVDLPGHGKSAHADRHALGSSNALLDCMLALEEQVAPGRPFAVVGESYGGYLALGVIARSQTPLLGVQLLCPLTVDLEARQMEPRSIIRKDEALLASLSDEERESFLQLAVRADRPTWNRFQAEEAPGFTEANLDFLASIDAHFPLDEDIDAVLAAHPFEKPVLIICGRQDSMVGWLDQERLLPLMPRCTFAVLDIAGHNLQLEQPELYTALAADWLRRTVAEAGVQVC